MAAGKDLFKETTGTDQTGASRGKGGMYVTFGRASFQEAQSTMSQFSGHVKKVDIAGERMYLQIRPKVDYLPGQSGVSSTSYTEYSQKRRIHTTSHWRYATIADSSDQKNTSYSILSDAREDLMLGKARLIDRVILNSQISGVIVEDDAAANTTTVTGSDDDAARDTKAKKLGGILADRALHGGLVTKVQYRQNLYCVLPLTNAGAIDDDADTPLAVPDFKLSQQIRRIFRKRNVGTNVPFCATLTPDLEYAFYVDPVFRNSEQIIKPTGSINNSVRGFVYGGINWIPTLEDVLPELGSANVLANTVSNKPRAVARGINLDSPIIDPALRDDMFTATALTAGDVRAGAYVVEADNLDDLRTSMVYVWHPSQLVYSARMENMKDYLEPNMDKEYGDQLYSRVDIGATLLQESHALQLLIGGTIKIKGTSTTATDRG